MVDRWNNKAWAYQNSFASLCAGTISTIINHLIPGQVADIGCGTGNASLAALQAGFSVQACDIQTDMLELAIANIDNKAQLRVDKIPELITFADNSVDNAVANFVINHVAAPLLSLQSIKRIVKSEGRIITTIWTNKFTPHRDLLSQLIKKYGSLSTNNSPTSPLLTAKTNFEHSVNGIAKLNTKAGITVITSTIVKWQWETTWNKFWLGINAGIGYTGSCFLSQPTIVQEKIKATLYKQLSTYQTETGTLSFPCQAALCVATVEKTK